MAVVQKQIKFIYTAKNLKSGLADVKGQIYFNGVAKLVGASAITLAEVDSVNSPGLYEATLTPTQLTTMGVVGTGYNVVEAYVNSASFPAPAAFRQELTIASLDDLNNVLGIPATTTISGDIAAVSTRIGAPAGASVSADIAAVKTDTAAIKADLETGSYSLQTILTNIQQLQNASIGNGVGYVLPTLLIPATGSTTYKIPITIQNDNGALVDPVANTVTVGVMNSAGVDKGAFLTGSSGTPATVSATRSAAGQYVATVVIPSTEVEEELIFSFAYTVGTNAMVRFGVSQTLADQAASGFALQTTLLATQATVNTINTAIGNATYGLAALQAILTNGTYGLSVIAGMLTNGTYGLNAIQTAIGNVQSSSTNNGNLLTNATYGLSALQAQAAANYSAIEGTGFATATDSLHAVSVYLAANVFLGGRAV